MYSLTKRFIIPRLFSMISMKRRCVKNCQIKFFGIQIGRKMIFKLAKIILIKHCFNDWLIVCCFSYLSKISHWHGKLQLQVNGPQKKAIKFISIIYCWDKHTVSSFEKKKQSKRVLRYDTSRSLSSNGLAILVCSVLGNLTYRRSGSIDRFVFYPVM